MAGTDTASTEATAPVEATPPAEKTNEEAFEEAFDEFAAVDDTDTGDPPAEGRKDDEDKPAPGEESPDADEAAADEPAAAPEDIWADATPEQKAAFEASKHENQSHRTRASAQNRKIAELMSAPESAAEPAADKDPDTAATPETDEDWEKFKSEYPEVAAPMEQRFETRLGKLEAENADLRGQVTGITDGQLQDAIDNEEALLVQRHPDWKQLTASDDFDAWVRDQPRYVQEGFARNGTAIVDGQEAASLIDLFKDVQAPVEGSAAPPKDTEKPSGKATRRQRRLESAVTTESGQAGPGAGPPEGDFDAAFDHFARQP